MYFKSLYNIQSSFRLSLILFLGSLAFFLVVTLYTVYTSRQLVAKEREKIYVLDSGNSLILALQQDIYQSRPVEMKNHVITFHELFYNLSPDVKAIEYNLARAFHLADKTPYKLFEDLTESGFYQRLVSTNTQQRIVFDSVVLNYKDYPYQATTYARQYIKRESNTTIRSLISSCTLENCTRSDNNPHGLIITNYKIISNKEISIEQNF